jgi:hypothetical protein
VTHTVTGADRLRWLKIIAAQLRGELPQTQKDFGDILAVCVTDAGNNGVLIHADQMLPPR